jgi:Major Facilitator Superfamily
MFWFFGTLGIAASAAWFAGYRNKPFALEESVSSSQESWASILRSVRFWSLLGTVFGSTFMWQFYITWFPTYLMENRGMALKEASVFAGLPFLLGLCSTWIGGLLTDHLARKLGVQKARRLIGFASLSSAALLMSAGLWCPPAKPAALLIAMAAGAVDLYLGAAWAVSLDIGGRLAGGVAGLMNTASNGAAFLSPVVTGHILKLTGNWNAPLLLGVLTTGVAAALWLKVTPANK